jgi:glycyl-tRNA synthetase beta chain
MSEMVYEFTELQGVMGCYYAKALGESDAVAVAIKEQYLPNKEDGEVPSTTLSAIVAMSLKLDTLIALFSINQIPTGSRDPFALRRAVNGIVRICAKHDLKFDIKEMLKLLSNGYESFDLLKLETFFLERLRQYYKVNPSIIEAVLVTGERELLAISKKIEALNYIVGTDGFSEYFSTFKRVANITRDVDVSAELFIDKTLFESSAEEELYAKYTKVVPATYVSYEEELDALFGLKKELDKFFDGVMVNAENEAIRNNRKSLIASIYKSILKIADIKDISI